jgi:hypothetical protein
LYRSGHRNLLVHLLGVLLSLARGLERAGKLADDSQRLVTTRTCLDWTGRRELTIKDRSVRALTVHIHDILFARLPRWHGGRASRTNPSDKGNHCRAHHDGEEAHYVRSHGTTPSMSRSSDPAPRPAP